MLRVEAVFEPAGVLPGLEPHELRLVSVSEEACPAASPGEGCAACQADALRTRALHPHRDHHRKAVGYAPGEQGVREAPKPVSCFAGIEPWAGALGRRRLRLGRGVRTWRSEHDRLVRTV